MRSICQLVMMSTQKVYVQVVAEWNINTKSTPKKKKTKKGIPKCKITVRENIQALVVWIRDAV